MDKQVVMGKLEPTHSFGEVSVILNEPVTCSIVTATTVEVATIEPHKLKGMCEIGKCFYNFIRLVANQQSSPKFSTTDMFVIM